MAALVDHLADVAGVAGAQVVHKAAGLGDFIVHLALGEFAGEAHLHNILDRQRAAAGGGHRAVPLGDIVGVDHLASAVGRDRDTAADVADDKVHLLVLFAECLGVADADFLLVQGVDTALAVDTLQAGDTGNVDELIDIRRVDDERLAAVLLGKGAGKLCAQHGRVLDREACVGVLIQLIVDRVGAARAVDKAAAAPNESIYAFQRLARLGHCVQDHLFAVGDLVVDLGEFFQFLGVVGDVLAEHLVITHEHGDLGGGRPRVNCKDFIFFHVELSSLGKDNAGSRQPRWLRLPASVRTKTKKRR